MQQLWLFNTLTRSKDLFVPIDSQHIRMYVCGPTVYADIHIGNARPLIIFDILFRLLRHLYGDKQVIYARNITDVDDKIIAQARARFANLCLHEAIDSLVELTNKDFQKDAKALGCLEPSIQPRVTSHIDVIRQMIEKLLQANKAYIAQEHVLFSVASFEDYGKLARQATSEMLAGARVEVAPYKRGAMDFVLWKPAKENEPSWQSPGGIESPGRPGWHIECSAMSMATLLEPYGGGLDKESAKNNVFDIHGGGIDLMFPHHENEIAQSCCSLNIDKMANYWVHNGYVEVDGKKMSKSENNFVSVRDIIGEPEDEYRSLRGGIARLAMLQTHYRSNFNWTKDRYDQAKIELNRWLTKIEQIPRSDGNANANIDEVILALCNDLNTSDVILHLREYFKNNELEKLAAALKFLGLPYCIETHVGNLEAYEHIIAQREAAIKSEDWKQADALRFLLASKGIETRDWKDQKGNRQSEYRKTN